LKIEIGLPQHSIGEPACRVARLVECPMYGKPHVADTTNAMR